MKKKFSLAIVLGLFTILIIAAINLIPKKPYEIIGIGLEGKRQILAEEFPIGSCDNYECYYVNRKLNTIVIHSYVGNSSKEIHVEKLTTDKDKTYIFYGERIKKNSISNFDAKTNSYIALRLDLIGTNIEVVKSSEPRDFSIKEYKK